MNQGSGWRYGYERCQGGGVGDQDQQDGSWASLFWWPELNFRDEGPCRGNELVMENMDDNKEKLIAKFAKMGQNFFNPVHVFYAFALCDSNNTGENLNWRNVKQMVQTFIRFGTLTRPFDTTV